MAGADVNLTQLAGGRLFFGVDDLSIAAPYGGTELGLVSSVFVLPPLGVVELPAEEDGASARMVYIGGDAIAGALMPTPDPQAIAAIYPGAGLGPAGPNQGPIITFPAKVGQPANEITNLLHVPTNVAEHFAWLMPIAVAALDEQTRLWYSHRRWLNYPVIWRSRADAQGRALVTGRLADLVNSL